MFIAIGPFMQSQFGYTMTSYLRFFMHNFESVYIIIYVGGLLLFLIAAFTNNHSLAIGGCVIGWQAVGMWLIVMMTINDNSGTFTVSFGFFSLIAGAILESGSVSLIQTGFVNHSDGENVFANGKLDFDNLPTDLEQLNSCDEEARSRFSELSSDNSDMIKIIEGSDRSVHEITERMEGLQARRRKLSESGQSTERIDSDLRYDKNELDRAVPDISVESITPNGDNACQAVISLSYPSRRNQISLGMVEDPTAEYGWAITSITLN